MKKLLQALEALKGKPIDSNLLRQTLESLDLKRLNVKEEMKQLDRTKFHRITLMEDPVQVFLMNWPPQFFYPIHQHKNFWGFVIPIEGFLSETLYGHAPNKRKVFVHPTKTFKEGELIYEPLNVIHKLQNTSPIQSMVTLHVYFPPDYGFEGTMIFDAKNRRLAVLNAQAEDLDWNLPADRFERIEEEAYDVEKLW